MDIPFISGISVKPIFISAIGDVTFTNGELDSDSGDIVVVNPNQTQCEACSAFRFNTNLDRNFANINNKTYGAGNRTGTGTNHTLIMGENNTVNGFSRNSIVTGNNNEITSGINNVQVIGTKGDATADNSIVLGGNANADNLGERQTIKLMYGVQTTTSGTVDSYLNNVTDSYFQIPDNTIMYFNAEIVAVRVGGTGTGSTGDFASFIERGVVINKSGTLSISRERDAIKSSGTVTLWRPTAAVDGTNFLIDIRGAANVTIEWAATIVFTQIKTGVAL